MNKRDLQFIMGILVIAAAAAGIFFVYARRGGGQKAGSVVVEQDGREILRLSLQEDRTVYLTGADGDGYNVLEIEDGRARIWEADCPEQICVQQGWISGPGEQIVCLPHRLVIRFVSEDGGEADAVACAKELI